MTPSELEDRVGESFAHLPSAKLLTDLVEWSRLELIARWDGHGAEDEHPVLGQLWSYARTAARATLRDEPKSAAAQAFLQGIEQMDAVAGDPRERGWLLSSIEADRRLDLVTEFLYGTGLLSLRETKADAPENFLTREEREGP